MLKPWLRSTERRYKRVKRLILAWPECDSWCSQHCGNTLVGKWISTHYISGHFMHFPPIWYIATNNAHWPCCCHIITNTCHLITSTCCLPNEMIVWWQHRLWLLGLSVRSGGFFSILRCLSHLGNLSLLLTLTLELKPSIFSFFTSNKCVRHLVGERLAVRDPYLLSWKVPTASHLSCLVSSEHRGCTVTLLMFQVGQCEDMVFLKDIKREF